MQHLQHSRVNTCNNGGTFCNITGGNPATSPKILQHRGLEYPQCCSIYHK
nr:MAG TPA: hypothetical protein [Caudoviricetes sp.]